MKPNPKEINIILNILKGAQFEFLPRAPFYIDTALCAMVQVSLLPPFCKVECHEHPSRGSQNIFAIIV
jgi:hypothetical protein